MADREPSATDGQGDVVLQKTPDGKPLPSYLDFEDALLALEKVRVANVHGYGYLETVTAQTVTSGDDKSGDDKSGDGKSGDGKSGDDKSGDDKSGDDDSGDEDGKTADHPWLNAPFADPRTGLPLGVGSGTLLPFTLDRDGGTEMLGRDTQGPRRTCAPLATFNAFAVALAGDVKDASGAFVPALRGRRLTHEVFRRWMVQDDDVPAEGAVSGLIRENVGVWVKTALVRRGDLLQIVWKDGGTHAVFCWDVRSSKDDLFIQIAGAQASSYGVGVLVSPESLGLVGALEPVKRKGLTRKHYVHHTDRGQKWLATADARAFYRDHGQWLRVPAKDDDTGLKVDQLYVGRFHRAFPRYPLALAGSNTVTSVTAEPMPFARPKDGHAPLLPARTRETSVELYFANNEGTAEKLRQGGFFPLGANRTWHGGIHLYPEADDAVTAPVDGQLVAARLTTPASKSKFGDTGFVLLKTRLKVAGEEIAFFTLLAHLAPMKVDTSIEWLAELASVPPRSDERWSQGLDPAKVWYRVVQPAKPGADREGADGPQGSLLVYEKRDRSLEPRGRVELGAVVEAEVALDAHGWAKVKPKSGASGWVYGDGRLERIDLLFLDEKLRDKREKLEKGEVVDFSDLERPLLVRAGEVVGHVGEVGGDRALHFEIFSSDLIKMNGKTKADIEETDSSLFTDKAKFEDSFFDQLKQTDEGGSGKDKSVQLFFLKSASKTSDDQVLEAEVRRFFATNVLRDRMRTLITRQHSEWGDQIDWKQLDSQPQFKHVPPAMKQAFHAEIGKLQWWKGSFLSRAGLPGDQIVYHYHPITFLSWLDEAREDDASGELHESVFELNHGSGSA